MALCRAWASCEGSFPQVLTALFSPTAKILGKVGESLGRICCVRPPVERFTFVGKDQDLPSRPAQMPRMRGGAMPWSPVGAVLGMGKEKGGRAMEPLGGGSAGHGKGAPRPGALVMGSAGP